MKLALPKNLGSLKMPRLSGRPKPQRDWFMFLSAAALLLALSVGWNVWIFYTAATGGQVGDTAPAAAPDTSSFDAVRALFEERATEEARYRTEYRFVDPSR
ncbi:MAG TPA: hypothetical protein VHO23_00515 [Candidatus Paceibacterota bacterium]|nr:hypothetical protein [Candidatus Paceibacterota bacterium]